MFESVTRRVKSIKQPYGGYLPRKIFKRVQLEDGNELNSRENIPANLMGLVVDYLTRLMMGASSEDAFDISLTGAKVLDNIYGNTEASEYAQTLIENIKGLDPQSITNACKMTGFDVCYRAGVEFFNPENIYLKPNGDTIENVAILVSRTVNFLKEYGPVIKDGFTFEGGGYTQTVSSGDGDYLTKDTLWDLKVVKNTFNKNYSLQILVYYLMGKHSNQSIFNDITKIGLFNPRLNEYYILNIAKVSKDIIQEVETEVIGYPTIDKIIVKSDVISDKNRIIYFENKLLQFNDDYTSYEILDNDVEKSLINRLKFEYCYELGITKDDFEYLKSVSSSHHKDKIIHDFKEANIQSVYAFISDENYKVLEDKSKLSIAVKASALKKAIKENADLNDSNVQAFLSDLEQEPHEWYTI